MQADLSVLSDVTLAWCDGRDENMGEVGKIAQFVASKNSRMAEDTHS